MTANRIAPIAMAAMTVAVIVAVNLFGYAGLAIPTLVLVSLPLVSRPKWLLLLFWSVTLLAPAAKVVLPSLAINAIEQGAGLFLLGVLLGDHIITRRSTQGTRFMTRATLGLCSVMVIAAIVNRVPPVAVLLYVLTYTKHLWAFYFTVRYLSARDGRAVFRVILFSLALQIVFNLFAVAGVNPLPRLMVRSYADFHVGTVGGAHGVGYLMVAGVLLMAALFRNSRSLSGIAAAVCGIVAMLVQFFFTFTMHAYPLLAGGLAVQHFWFSRRSIGRTARTVLLAITFGSVLGMLFSLERFETLREQLTSEQAVAKYWERVRYGAKYESYRQVFLHPGRHIRYGWLGAGPGNYTSRTAFLHGRPLSRLPHLFHIYEAMDPTVRRGGSILVSTRTGLIALWGELGPAGTLLYLWMYVYAAMRILRQRRSGLYRDPYRIMLAEAFVPVMCIFLLLNTIVDHLASLHLNVGIWIWAACLWNPPPADGQPLLPGAPHAGPP